MQDEGTAGVEALQALRAWVRPFLRRTRAMIEANREIVVTRRPRELLLSFRRAVSMAGMATFSITQCLGWRIYATWLQRTSERFLKTGQGRCGISGTSVCHGWSMAWMVSLCLY